MPEAYACCTLFTDVRPEEIIETYEACVEPADGYLTRLSDDWHVFVDAMATECADWPRQIQLAHGLTEEGGTAISVFLVGQSWALAISREGKGGPVAAFAPDDESTMDGLPQRLLGIEHLLGEWFPGLADTDAIDCLLGAVLQGAVSAEEAITEVLNMLEVPGDWLRWSWYETIPEQLFLDPDLEDRVIPLGNARHLWEE